ncbi:MAG: hypothetical protein WC654_04935 [Patescibacteria group bacterium]
MRYLAFIALFILGTGCITPVAPVETEPESETFTVSNLTFEIPSPWTVVSSDESTAVIRTEIDPYLVDVVMEVEEIDEVDTFDGLAATTSVAKIYNVAQGGAFDWYYMSVGDKSYSIVWQIESTQPLPADLDGIWVPDHTVSREQLLDVLKTVSVVE